MSNRDNAALQIERAQLPNNTTLIAYRLLEIADRRTGHAKITMPDMQRLAGPAPSQSAAEGTARKQLIALSNAGVIHYSINGYVSVDFMAWDAKKIPFWPESDPQSEAPDDLTDDSPARVETPSSAHFDPSQRASDPLPARVETPSSAHFDPSQRASDPLPARVLPEENPTNETCDQKPESDEESDDADDADAHYISARERTRGTAVSSSSSSSWLVSYKEPTNQPEPELVRPAANSHSNSHTACHPQPETIPNSHAAIPPTSAAPPLLEVEYVASMSLLTDEAVNITPALAEEFSKIHSFEWLMRQVGSWWDEMKTKRVSNAGALVNRIKQKYRFNPISDDFKRSPLYAQHYRSDLCPKLPEPNNGNDDLAHRRKYLAHYTN